MTDFTATENGSILTAAFAIAALLLLPGFSNPSVAQDAEKLYGEHCAGCHGSGLEGTAAAGGLIKDSWFNGSSQQAIRRSISEGVPGTTMISWNTQLEPGQIRALTRYILEANDKPVEDVAETETPAITDTLDTHYYRLRVDVLVAEGLNTPWGIEFVSPNRALISERPGSLKWMVDGELIDSAITGLPTPHTESSTGGFMDIALDPDYEENGWIYLAYSHTNEDIHDEDARSLTKIIRGKIQDNAWTMQQTLFEAPEQLKVVGGNRWGGRLLFDDRDRLLFTIGDMARGADSQDLTKAVGKVFRIMRDGSIPHQNPFVDTPGALPQIFTFGNRNVQGLSIHPETRELWSSEHGPQGGDEINILYNGHNYGWPVITYGIDYDGSLVSRDTRRAGMEQPIYQWTPSIAVCPIAFVEGNRFPAWRNNLLVGALKFQELRRLTVVDQRVIHEEVIMEENGRVREIVFGPDGALYLLTNGPDRVLRITPGEERPRPYDRQPEQTGGNR